MTDRKAGKMINLAIPNLEGREREYLNRCIDTTFVSSVGEYVNRFEEQIAAVTGSRYAVATSAGTTGLHAALTAVGVRRDELVIIPSFTFIATANAVAHCGAMPWLMDIRAEDWCLDPETVEAEIMHSCEMRNGALIHRETGKRVAALMPVYTIGNLPDMKRFRRIADMYGIPLVADAACAIGAKWQGENFGSHADLSVLSFNGNKTVTCGGGGAVIGNDENLLKLVKHLTTTARVGREYDFDMVGFNYRMTNLQAAVGCAQLERLDAFLSRKRFVRSYYESAFHDCGVSSFPTTDMASCWFSGVILPDGKGEEDVRSICKELADAGIEARSFWKPVHLQKPYRSAPVSAMKNTEAVWDRIITLPCSTGITEEELKTVRDTVRTILKEHL